MVKMDINDRYRLTVWHGDDGSLITIERARTYDYLEAHSDTENCFACRYYNDGEYHVTGPTTISEAYETALKYVEDAKEDPSPRPVQDLFAVVADAVMGKVVSDITHVTKGDNTITFECGPCNYRATFVLDNVTRLDER